MKLHNMSIIVDGTALKTPSCYAVLSLIPGIVAISEYFINQIFHSYFRVGQVCQKKTFQNGEQIL